MVDEKNYPKEVYRVQIDRSRNGVAYNETWFMDGKHHRIDGPAMISRCPVTGAITYEAWFQHGKLHRVDGPALIKRKPDTGRVYYSVWFEHDVHVPAPHRPPRRRTLTPPLPSNSAT
jgi:hypothetical protein